MRIVSWNVNGLRAILKKNFAEFVAEYSPDILCLQETKVSRDLVGGLELPFPHCDFNCAVKKGYSGVAILGKPEPERVTAVDLPGHPDEGRILCADFGAFNLVSVYVPNSQDGLRRLAYRRLWNADFCAYVRGLEKPAIVCGDLNVAHEEIDIARPDDNRLSAGFSDEERADFTSLLKDADLADVWREFNPGAGGRYTWWSYRGGARARNVGWRIDYFLVSRPFLKNVKKAEILDGVAGSDHCPILLEI